MNYSRKIPLDLTCGIGVAREVILSKWKYCILTEIEKGVARPTALKDAIPDITKRVLQQQLKELEFYKVIEKETYAEVPPRVEYSLTKLGKNEVLPLLKQVDDWGMKYLPTFQELVEENNLEKTI